MKPQDDASHYVAAHQVPQIDATSSVARFFAVLQGAARAGSLFSCRVDVPLRLR